jgi:hypothetical protein
LTKWSVVINIIDLEGMRHLPSILCKSSSGFHLEAFEVLLECYPLKKVRLIVKKWVQLAFETAELSISALELMYDTLWLAFTPQFFTYTRFKQKKLDK